MLSLPQPPPLWFLDRSTGTAIILNKAERKAGGRIKDLLFHTLRFFELRLQLNTAEVPDAPDGRAERRSPVKVRRCPATVTMATNVDHGSPVARLGLLRASRKG